MDSSSSFPSSITTYINTNLTQLNSGPSPSSTPLFLLSPTAVASHFAKDKYSTYLFDCDGCLYRDKELIPGSDVLIKELMKRGKKVYFVTNSSGRSCESMCVKLKSTLGLENLTVDQMIPSCLPAAWYLSKQLRVKKAFIVGGQGIADELGKFGISCLGGAEDSDQPAKFSESDIENYQIDSDVRAVIVGMDDGFTYAKVAKASLYLQNPDVLFIATNKDAFDVMPSGRHQPAGGVMTVAIEHATGRPATLVGKPSTILGDMMRDKLGIDLSSSLFLGDRIDTDILFGNINRIDSCLVLSGCTTGSDVNNMVERGEPPLPSIIIPSVGHAI